MQFGTSLGAQWLRLHVPSIGGVGSIPGQGTTIPFTSSPPPHPPKRKCNLAIKILYSTEFKGGGRLRINKRVLAEKWEPWFDTAQIE